MAVLAARKAKVILPLVLQRWLPKNRLSARLVYDRDDDMRLTGNVMMLS